MLDHVVEATTEVTDFVVAVGIPYRDIEVAFSDAHNLALKFPHNKPEISATVSCS